MESKVAKSSQRSPVILITGYSFLLLVLGPSTTITISDPAVAIGHRPSIRTTRTTRTTCSSIQATSAGPTKTGMTATPFVLSQNKLRAALPSAVAKRQIVGMQGVSPASPTKPGRKPCPPPCGQVRKGGQYSVFCHDVPVRTVTFNVIGIEVFSLASP